MRLRVLFAPRFVCSTFPSDDSEGSRNYLKTVEGLSPPFSAIDYEKVARKVHAEHGVHVDIRLADGTPGVQGKSIPRQALVRADKKILLIFSDSRFDEDVVAMFNQMVGVPATRTHTAADYAALITALPAEVAEAVAEIVS